MDFEDCIVLLLTLFLILGCPVSIDRQFSGKWIDIYILWILQKDFWC